jgi:hypothetical protein
MLIFALSTSAFADCPTVATLVADARAAFDDAEVEAADGKLEATQQLLACQAEVVPTDALLDLFRLHVLVDLARQDKEGAVYATIRAVVTEPGSAPSADYGPQVVDLYTTWRSRLGEPSLAVKAEGTDQAWVDGHVVPKSGTRVLAGEHLIQWRDADGFHSKIQDASAAFTITGKPSAVAVVEPDPVVPDPVVPDPVEPPVDRHPPKEPKPPRDRQPNGSARRPVLLATSGLLAAGGGGAVLLGFLQESAFHANSYDAVIYGPCDRTMACYDNARADAIKTDAGRIRTLYAGGYGLVGAGVLLAGTELVLLPSPGGASLRVSGSW